MAGVFPLRSCDNWNVSSGTNPCLYVGGNYNQNQNHGLFYVNYNTTSNAYGNVGGRVRSNAHILRLKPERDSINAGRITGPQAQAVAHP